jgi:hypothetical protein
MVATDSESTQLQDGKLLTAERDGKMIEDGGGPTNSNTKKAEHLISSWCSS